MGRQKRKRKRRMELPLPNKRCSDDFFFFEIYYIAQQAYTLCIFVFVIKDDFVPVVCPKGILANRFSELTHRACHVNHK